MEFSELSEIALEVRRLYEMLEQQQYGRSWNIEEIGLGFVGDVGDLAKLLQADAGIRKIEDHKDKLGHELSDCLWSLMILADKCGIDLESEFIRNMKDLNKNVSSKINV